MKVSNYKYVEIKLIKEKILLSTLIFAVLNLLSFSAMAAHGFHLTGYDYIDHLHLNQNCSLIGVATYKPVSDPDYACPGHDLSAAGMAKQCLAVHGQDICERSNADQPDGGQNPQFGTEFTGKQEWGYMGQGSYAIYSQCTAIRYEDGNRATDWTTYPDSFFFVGSCDQGYYISYLPPPPDQGKCDNKASKQGCVHAPDPINIGSGNENFTETDYQSADGKLVFGRNYNSLGTESGAPDQGILGAGWTDEFHGKRLLNYQELPNDALKSSTSTIYSTPQDACLQGAIEIGKVNLQLQGASVSYNATNYTCSINGVVVSVMATVSLLGQVPEPSIIELRRDDGSIYQFRCSTSGCISSPDVPLKMSYLYGGVGAIYTVTDLNDTKEIYDYRGKLQSIVYRNGYTQNLIYGNYGQGNLQQVVDSFGRALVFSLNQVGLIISVGTPDGTISFGYDNLSRLSSVTYADQSVKNYQYNDPNHVNALTDVIDENGSEYANISYDSNGYANQSHFGIDSLASLIDYSDQANPIVTDSLGISRTYHFRTVNGRQKIGSTSGMSCHSCGFDAITTYDSAGYFQSKQDWNGNITTYIYDDSRGLETSRTEAAGSAQSRTINTTWHPAYRLPTEIDEPGRKTTFSYDGTGNLLTKTLTDTANNAARTWTYSNYTSWGAPQTIDGPRTDVSDITQVVYYNCTSGSQCGQVQTITNALGQITTFNSYDASGRPLTYTDPNGVVITLTYTTRGWLNTRQVGNETTIYTYDKVGQLQSVNWPNGTAAIYTYDAAHRLTDVYDQLNNHAHYTLDAMGNRVGTDIYDAIGIHVQTHSATIDSLNRLQQDVGAYNNEITTYLYDANDNLVSLTDANYHQTLFYIDALNRVSQVTDPNNGQTNLTLNSLDQLTQVSDPRSLTTGYSIDALGNITTLISPDTGRTTSTYDAAGNRITSVDANGNKTTYTYDALNRLTKVGYTDGRNAEYTYDQGGYAQYYNIGHLTTVANWTGTSSYYYDLHGRVAYKAVNVEQKYVTNTYNFDSTRGQLTSMTLPSGKTLIYTWTNGKITGIAADSSPLIGNIVYQPFGAPKSWTLGNNELVARTFDLDGRITGTAISTVTYDQDSRVSAINLGGKSILSGSKSYGYDVLDRMSSYTSGSGSIGYSYDAGGNLLSSTDAALPVTYSIAANSNRIDSATKHGATTPFSYSANGNILNDADQSYNYLNSNQRFYVGNGFYGFDGLQQRVLKYNGVFRFFAYDESGRIIGEYGNAGGSEPVEETVWLGDMPVAVIEPTGNYFIHVDHLNTPRQIDNANGLAVWAWDSQTYGSTASNLPNQDPRNIGNQFVYNLRYPGQYYDIETGHMTNGYREYDPASGRYVQSDPIGLAAGLNTYAYVGGNPIGLIDPSGLAGMVVYFNGYSVDTGMGFSAPLGHAGVVAIDDKTGSGQYFDFGRYGGEYGNVRGPFDAGTLTFDKNGMPTPDSLHAMGEALAHQFGKDSTATIVYNKNADAQKIIDFALNRKGHEDKFPYTLNPLSKHPLNFCDTFAVDALGAGLK